MRFLNYNYDFFEKNFIRKKKSNPITRNITKMITTLIFKGRRPWSISFFRVPTVLLLISIHVLFSIKIKKPVEVHESGMLNTQPFSFTQKMACLIIQVVLDNMWGNLTPQNSKPIWDDIFFFKKNLKYLRKHFSANILHSL